MANIRELKWLHRWNNMQLQGRRKFGDWNEKERKFIELINWLHATCIKRRTWHFGRNNNKSLTFALAVTSDTLFLFHWAAFEGSQHWWLLFTAELSSLFISLFKFRTKKRADFHANWTTRHRMFEISFTLHVQWQNFQQIVTQSIMQY